jgi:hypothetical protein
LVTSDKEDFENGRNYRLQSVNNQEGGDGGKSDLIDLLEKKLSNYCEQCHGKKDERNRTIVTDNT